MRACRVFSICNSESSESGYDRTLQLKANRDDAKLARSQMIEHLTVFLLCVLTSSNMVAHKHFSLKFPISFDPNHLRTLEHPEMLLLGNSERARDAIAS